MFHKCLSNLSNLLLIPLISMTFLGCSGKLYPEPAAATADVLSQFNDKSNAQPETMRIVTRVDYVDEIHNKRVVGQDLIVSAGAPQNMRITISAFDKAISTMVTNGIGFSLMDVTQNVFVSGMATPNNIARILPVYLSASDLYRVITGGYPTDGLAENAAETEAFAWDPKIGGYCRTLNMANGNIERVYQSWPDGDIFRITVESEQGTEYIYEASGFKNYDWNGAKLRYPDQVIFRLPQQKTDVRLRVEKRDIDVEFSPAVFRLVPPAGTDIIMLDDPRNSALQPDNSNAAEPDNSNTTEPDNSNASVE